MGIYDDLTRDHALDPATRPLPPYDCPTGTCRTDKICEEIELGDPIDPFGRAHIERNACNRCPSSNPDPITHTVPQHGRNPERTVTSHYIDPEGNMWQPDSRFTAPRFHGDAGLGHRRTEDMTFRLQASVTGGTGWQCRYYAGALDDASLDLGTYDYAPAPAVAQAIGNRVTFRLVPDVHRDMDVDPHNANPNYAPNLTEQF